MSDVSARLRSLVTERAGDRCEYCGLSQAGQEARFHIDHVHPRAAGGESVLNNLALACVSCSLRKGARVSAPDPDDGANVPLFNPRIDRWQEHFAWQGPLAIARTPTGRGTLAALDLNRPLILAIRREEMLLGRHPPR